MQNLSIYIIFHFTERVSDFNKNISYFKERVQIIQIIQIIKREVKISKGKFDSVVRISDLKERISDFKETISDVKVKFKM